MPFSIEPSNCPATGQDVTVTITPDSYDYSCGCAILNGSYTHICIGGDLAVWNAKLDKFKRGRTANKERIVRFRAARKHRFAGRFDT